jgi:hypothetical protein
MNRVTLRVVFWAAIAMTLASGSGVDAATFRMTTKIYQGTSLDAVAEHEILFDEGLTYDLPQIDARFVTVYDPAQKRVTLLDRQTQQQTTIGIDDLVKVTAQARAAANGLQQQARLGLRAAVGPSNRVIGYTIRFGNVEYHTTAQRPANGTIAKDYGRFADLASRLNLVRRLGPPPFGRMTLNQYMVAKGELPLETTLTLRHGETTSEYRSTHQL